MRKRLICLFAILTLCSLAACGADNKQDCCENTAVGVNECCEEKAPAADYPSDIPDCCGGQIM